MKPIHDICVVGTDTGVGKSVVSLLLMQLLLSKGYHPFYLKPFQTGCRHPGDKESDAAFVYLHTPGLRHRDPAQSVVYCYPNPKAPFFAARDAGQKVDPAKVRLEMDRRRSNRAPVIVEAAGGLLVPITADQTVLDIIPMIDCPALLVARAGLGTINHTLLSIEALQHRRIPIQGVVLVASVDATADSKLVAENMDAVERFSGVRVGGVIPLISDFAAPVAAAYHPLEKILF